MKKFRYLIAAAAALAVLASCDNTKEPEYVPGEPDVAGCYGVYFVDQSNSNAILSPVADKKFTFTLARANSNGAITVPVTATYSDDVFSKTDITFADGQSETTFDVSFPNAQPGVKYTMSFVIDDHQYSSMYDEHATYLNWGFMIVENVKFGTATFYQEFWEEEHTADVWYYEVDGVRYCHTENEEGIWGTGTNMEFLWYTNLKYEGYQVVEVPAQFMGWYYQSNSSQPVNFYDWYHYWKDCRADAAVVGLTFQEFLNSFSGNYPPSYYDGNGGFYFNLKYYVPGVGGWTGYDYDVEAITEGFTRVDYSFAVQQDGVAEAGKLPLTFKLGPDIAKARYTFIEGSLLASEVAAAISALEADASAPTVDKADEDVAAKASTTESVEVTLEKTGIYTLVAVGLDASGKSQASASIEVKYLAEGDDKEVIFNAGLASTAKYTPQGYLPDNTLEYYVYGTDLVDVKVALFKYTDIAANQAACINSLLTGASVSADVLAEINDKGYTGIFTKLNPGTEYWLAVYASNGYEETYGFMASATTAGDPLPVYMEYTLDDFDGDLAPASSEGYFGNWNFYAVNGYGSLGMREYLGKVSITDSEIPDSEPDEDGYIDEYVNISGLFSAAANRYKFDDTQLWDFYGGYLYNLGAAGQQLAPSEGGYYPQIFVINGNGSIYRGYGSMLIGGYVADGYVAFMSSKLYNSGSLGENGLFLRFYNDEDYSSVAGNVAWIYDILLVDPEKDDNGLAPNAAAAQTQARLRAVSDKFNEAPANLVETPSGRMKSIIDEINASSRQVRNYGTSAADVKGRRDITYANFSSSRVEGKAAKGGRYSEPTSDVFVR